jgi:hypothetical protein
MFFVASRVVVGNSDGASLVLEGQSVGHGHLVLQGWALSLDSFWTSEVPLYALGYLLVGVDPLLLRVVPVVLAAAAVVLGVVLARDGARRGAAVAATVTVGALLAFPTHTMTLYFLLGGAHVGALVCSLVAVVALRRHRWGVGAVVAVVSLTLGMLGDLQTVAYGTAPIFVAGLVAMARRRSVRGGALPAVVALASVGAAVLIRGLTAAAGAFSIGSANPVADRHEIVDNVRDLGDLGGSLLGTNSDNFGTGGTPGWLADVHVVGAVVVVAALALALARLVVGVIGGERPAPALAPGTGGGGARWWRSEPSSWPVDDMLALATLGALGSYLGLTIFDNSAFTRYLTASVVMASILAGRVVARAWSRAGIAPIRRGIGVVGAIVALSFAAGFGYTLSVPGPVHGPTLLGGWLQDHHLTSGVGAYWSSSITTVESHGRVAVRPVIADPAGQLVRYDRETTTAWYTGRHFDFLVYQPGAPWDDVDASTAQLTWGPAAATYQAYGYEILVWAHPFTVPATGGFGAAP